MKILVFGKTGQVAQELQRQADTISLGRDQADLSHPAHRAEQIRQYKPDVVINAAAFTAVDLAEDQEPQAAIVNGAAPTAMAQAAAKIGVPFLHISTDYVFAGGGTHYWRVNDTPAPIGAYGRTKLIGEAGVANAGGQYAVLRTSWVFSAHGNNFVKTMLRLGKTRDALSVVNDQIGGPTPASGIAAALINMAKAFHSGKGENGLYHYSGAPETSWMGFAKEIFSQAALDVSVTGISSSEYPTPAARPLNSRMDCRRIEQVFGVKQPDWRLALRDVLQELED